MDLSRRRFNKIVTALGLTPALSALGSEGASNGAGCPRSRFWDLG
jgi:hypothetical protein